MILIAGGTGLLGSAAARQLLKEGKPVRILTRDPIRALKLKEAGADVVKGDMNDPSTLGSAMKDIKYVIATANSFAGKGKSRINTDKKGNRNLIDAAKAAGVEHFIFMSCHLPDEFRKIDFFRYKLETEEYLKNSGVPFTIIRSTLFMDVWAQLIGVPLIRRGRTTIFGKGQNPVNFIAVEDVVKIIRTCLNNHNYMNSLVTIGGPENLTLRQVAETFEQVTRKKGQRKHAFLPALKIMAFIMGLYSPTVARQMKTAILIDTARMEFNSSEIPRIFPIRLTKLKEWVKTKYA